MTKVELFIKILRETKTSKLKELLTYAEKQKLTPAASITVDAIKSELAMRALS